METVMHLYLYQATHRNSQTSCCVQYESQQRENFRSYDCTRMVCWHTTFITVYLTAATCFGWFAQPKHVAAIGFVSTDYVLTTASSTHTIGMSL